MLHIPKPVRYALYVLWSIFGLFVLFLFAGLAVYRFDIPGYIEYLNTRSIAHVSLTNPITLYHLFVPDTREEVVTLEDILADTGYMDTTGEGLNLDPDFEDFFSDFSQKDVSSVIVTGEDFGFSMQGESDQESGAAMSADKEEAFLERLKQREARLELQSESE